MGDGGSRFEDEFGEMRRDAFRTALGVLGDVQLADDAAAEALTQAWLHWSRIADLDYRTAWIRRVALNAAFRILRKRQRREVPALEPVAGFEDAASDRLTLAPVLIALPRRQRQVVALHYLADLTDPDIAALLGISLNSVKKHLSRGLSSLRHNLGGGERLAHDAAPAG